MFYRFILHVSEYSLTSSSANRITDDGAIGEYHWQLELWDED